MTWNFLVLRFMEDVNTEKNFHFLFLNLDTVLQNQLQKIPQHLTILYEMEK